MSWEKTISRNADASDTINLIIETIRDYGDTEEVREKAAKLKPEGDKYHYFKRLFDDVYQTIRYKLDNPGTEEVWTPKKLMREKQGDCKKMATLIASVLKQVGIEPYLKHVEFTGEDYSHIYVIVPYPTLDNYVTIDPVNDGKFDEEVKHDKATIYDLNGNKMELKQMGKTPTTNNGGTKYAFVDSLAYTNATIDNDISSLAGCGCQIGAEPSLSELERIYGELLTSDFATMPNRTAVTTQQPTDTTQAFSIGRLSKEERKARRQRILAKVKTVSLALPRAAFLFVLRVNPKKFANKMAAAFAKDPNKVNAFWVKVGGNTADLQKAILAGSSVPPIEVKTDASGGLSVSDMRGIKGIGIIGAATIATALTTATPLIIAANTLIKGLKAGAGTEGTQEESDKETDEFDEQLTEPGEKELDAGSVDKDLVAAAYSGGRPGATSSVLKYSPEALLKYYADNGIDVGKQIEKEKEVEKVVDDAHKEANKIIGSFDFTKLIFTNPLSLITKAPIFLMGFFHCSPTAQIVCGSLIAASCIYSLIKK